MTLEKGFIKYLLIWLGVTTITIMIHVKAITTGRWFLIIGLIPVTGLLLAIPIAGRKIGELATEASVYYQTKGWQKNKHKH